MQKNILVIAPTRIGDAILAASLLAHLQQQPESKVTIATSRLSAPLYESYPMLREIIRIEKQSFSRHWLNIWQRTCATRWQAVYDFRGSALAYMLRADRRFVFKAPAQPMPKVEQFAHAFGIKQLPYPTLWTSPKHDAEAETLIPPHENILAIAPIANWAPKEWPLAHFETVAKQLLSGDLKGYRPMVICAAHEREKALPLLNALTSFSPIDVTRGETSLLGIYAGLKRCKLFVGNDSGLMHMAAAAAIPTLGLFGPTDAIAYQPWGAKARALIAPEGNLQALSPDTVVQALSALIIP